MGCGTSESKGSQRQRGESQLQVMPRSEQEQMLLDSFMREGKSQEEALAQMRQEAMSGDPFKMSPESQATLDEAYRSSRLRFLDESKQYADFLAGGRGMRMSDTPVSEQALNKLGLGLADIESNRANAKLNFGLQGNAYRTGLGLATAQALPSGYVAAFNPLFSERMATGVQRFSSKGDSYQTQNMSPMQQVLMGTQAYNQFGQGTNQFMQAGMSGMKMGLF